LRGGVEGGLEQQLIDFLHQSDCLYGPRQGVPWVRRVLTYGRIFEAAPAGLQPERGEPNQCYRNAFRASRVEGPVYCEGWAMPNLECLTSLPVLHAWLLDAEGRVLETTWERVGLVYIGLPVGYAWHFSQAVKFRTATLCEEVNASLPKDLTRPHWLHPIVNRGRPLPPPTIDREALAKHLHSIRALSQGTQPE